MCLSFRVIVQQRQLPNMVSEPGCVVQGGQSVHNEDRWLRRELGYVDGWLYCESSVSDAQLQKCACGKGLHKSTVF